MGFLGLEQITCCGGAGVAEERIAAGGGADDGRVTMINGMCAGCRPDVNERGRGGDCGFEAFPRFYGARGERLERLDPVPPAAVESQWQATPAEQLGQTARVGGGDEVVDEAAVIELV